MLQDSQDLKERGMAYVLSSVLIAGLVLGAICLGGG
ncbi:hypothetical protein BH20ACT1_BH20ACT1_09770 [soil metagenome]